MKHSLLLAIVLGVLAAAQVAAAGQYQEESSSMDAERVEADAPDSSAAPSVDRPRTITESLP